MEVAEDGVQFPYQVAISLNMNEIGSYPNL